VATNDLAALLDMIFAKAPAANIIVGTADEHHVRLDPFLSHLWH